MPKKSAKPKEIKKGEEEGVHTRTVTFPRPLMKRLKQIALDRDMNVQDFMLEALERVLKEEKY